MAAGCFTSSARPARNVSGSCGTTCPTGRSGRWCWLIPALADRFASVDYFEKRRLPFVVAINCFEGAYRYDPDEVRAALDLGPRVPVILCDARETESVKNVLIGLVEHVLASLPGESDGTRPAAAVPPLA